jgi:hypothetical protein
MRTGNLDMPDQAPMRKGKAGIRYGALLECGDQRCIAVPLMVVMMLMDSQSRVMGEFTMPLSLNIFRLAGNGNHGGRRHRDICHLERLKSTDSVSTTHKRMPTATI